MMRAIGLDIGTTTISAVVVNGETGKILETITRQNNSAISSKFEWEKLQDPSIIVHRIQNIIQDFEEKYSPITSIGLTGQMHGIVYVDNNGGAQTPLVTWQDGRGNLVNTDGVRYADHLSTQTGYHLATGFGAVTHYYNTINNLLPKQAKVFCTIQDYVGMKLVNRSTPLLHPTNAASFGCFDLETGNFDQHAIHATGMDDTFFPKISQGNQLLGTTKSKIPVAIAIGDNQSSFLGSVNSTEDCLFNVIKLASRFITEREFFGFDSHNSWK